MVDDVSRVLTVGLSHHTAPVEVRERLAMNEAAVRRQLTQLLGGGLCEEAFLVSTCNRVELYAVPTSEDALHSYFEQFRTNAGGSLDQHLYWHRGGDAVRHLFRVASSLDSLVLGEPQILGQVKDAVRIAHEVNALGKTLHPLTQRSFSVAKRVRTETDLGRFRVGVGNAGVDLASQVFGGLASRRALLVGVGEMGRQVGRALLNAGLSELLITNRTDATATQIAEEMSATSVPYGRMAEYLSRVDVVVVATSSATPILGVPEVQDALKSRGYRPLVLIDLSVPRNVDPRIEELPDAFLFNVDDLRQVVSQGQAKRLEASERAMRLVKAEAARYLSMRLDGGQQERLARMAQHAEEIRLREIQRSRGLMDGLNAEQQAQLEALTKALVRKVVFGDLDGSEQGLHDDEEG